MMRKKLVSVLTISVICVSMLLGCSVSTDTGDASLNEGNTSNEGKLPMKEILPMKNHLAMLQKYHGFFMMT